MNLLSKPAQIRILSNFFNDLAKGVVLAALLGQGNLEGLNFVGRLAVSLVWLVTALLSLLLALFFSRYD